MGPVRREPRKTVALDSSVLSVLAGKPGRHKDALAWCTVLLEDHSSDRIVIPAPAYAEVASFLQNDGPLKKLVLDVVSLGPVGAAISHKLWMGKHRSGAKRQCLKTDILILGCAIEHQASVLYSEDGHFVDWFATQTASQVKSIQVMFVPPPPPGQPKLPTLE